MAIVSGYGSYIPLYRIERATIGDQYSTQVPPGELAVPGRDENHITMATEAAENALARAKLAGPTVDAVFTASITDELATHGIASHVAYKLGADGDVWTVDFQGSARAAGDAVLAAQTFLESRGEHVLVIGTDMMPVEPGSDDEPFQGCGAGALLLSSHSGSDRNAAATIRDIRPSTSGFIESHRRHGSQRNPGNQKFERQVGYSETISPALETAAETLGGEPDLYTLPVFDHRASLREEAVSSANQISTFDEIGYAGAASFFLDLARLLDEAEPDSSAVAISYGGGGAVVLALEIGGAPTPSEKMTTLADYLESKEYVTYGEHLEKRQSPNETTEVPV